MKAEESTDVWAMYGERPSVWSVDFCWNTENNRLNPRLILAGMLTDQGVSINPNAVDSQGGALPRLVEIDASPRGKRILSSMNNTPELRSLTAGIGSTGASLMDSLAWDKDTKTRARALSLQIAAERLTVGDDKERLTREVEAMLRSSGLEPFTPDDIRTLLEPVVARVLSEISA